MMIDHTAAPQGKDQTLILIPQLSRQKVIQCSYIEYIRGYQNYKAGYVIQEAFPKLNIEELNFLQTGEDADDFPQVSPDE
jgi:hypothetical protein